MKSTQLTELFANIRKTFVSFFSILMFVALGVGIFLGISWAGPALQNAAETQFDENSLHHFQIQYLYGLTDDDLAKLKAVDGVSDVEAARQSFQRINVHDGQGPTVKVQTLAERMDVPTVVEGQLPSQPDEIALNEIAARELGYSVGDTVTFAKDGANSGDDALAALASSAGGTSGETPAPDKDGMKFLMSSTFKVTALVKSAEYIAKDSATFGISNTPSGSVDMLAWVPASAFDGAAFQNAYPIVQVACDGLVDLSTFTDDYEKRSAEIEARITELGATLAESRFNDLHGEAESKVAEAEAKLAEGKQKVVDGEKQLVDGRAELETKKAEGEAKLAAGYDQLMYYEGLRAEGEAKLVAAREKVALGEAALAAADAAKAEVAAEANAASAYKAEQDQKLAKGEITQEQHDANLDKYGADVTARLQHYGDMVGIKVPVIDHKNFDEAIATANNIVANFENTSVTYQGQTMTVAQARVKLEEGRAQLAAGETEYNQRVAQINSGWATYYAGQEELNTLVAEGEQKIADGEAQLADAKRQVEENEPKVIKAREQIDSMKSYKWAVMSRSYNAGVVEVSTFSGVTGNLSLSMAALFIIVGLLVSYSAVSRIVHEQITQIGTKKALGLRSREITLSFLAYSGIAVISGAIVGTIVGIIVVEGIIGHVLGGMFTFGDYPPYFGLPLFLVVTLLELVLVLGATWFACRGILREHAVELLKGEKPPTGKTRFYEKWGIWDKLPLLTQTIVNNCVNDKRRVFSTVVGVAGCTALIVTAITLNNDVLKSYDAHYDDVYKFNGIAFVDSTIDSAVDGVVDALEGQGASAVPALRKSFILSLPGGDRSTVRLIVPADNEKFSELYRVNSVSGEGFDPSAEGVWVSQAYAEHFGAKPGDKISFEDSDGVKHEVPILGFYEFWLTYHEMVMGQDFYNREFFGELQPNTVLTDTNGTSVEDVSKSLVQVKGFDSITDDKIYQHKNFETFSSVSSAVVLIYMALSILMAIVVLLNLNVMFISEKKRELIVLMINGFSVKDAKRYIYNDTIVLTAIGIILGIVLGCIMGSLTVGSIEPTTASFIKRVDWMAVLIGAVGSAVLSFVMSMIALRRIPKFDLTDINKF